MSEEKKVRPSDNQKISSDKVEETTCSSPPSLWFGTDLSVNTSAKEAIEIFTNALKAGFTRFDTAYSYTVDDTKTVLLFDKAVDQCGFDRQKLTVMYKLKVPVAKEDATLDAQLKLVKKWGSTILTLHDVSGDMDAVLEFAAEVGKVAKQNGMLVGMSNVSDTMLGMLLEVTDIHYLQNRFTPYTETQWEIVKACSSKKITYLAYGLAGSAFGGSCTAKGGVPTDLLSAVLDPVLVKAAGDSGKLRYMLCEWALKLDIQPVVLTTGLKRMQEYLQLKPQDQLKAVWTDAVCCKKTKFKIEAKLGGNLDALAVACDSPFFARLLTFLVNSGADKFLDALASKVGKHKLEQLAYNLLRLAFDFQQAHYYEEPEAWLKDMAKWVIDWSKSNNDATFASACAFAVKSPYEHVDGGPTKLCEAILNGSYGLKKEKKVEWIRATIVLDKAITKEQADQLDEALKLGADLIGLSGDEDDTEVVLHAAAAKCDDLVNVVEEITGKAKSITKVAM